MSRSKDLRLYEELAHQVAMDASERRELTPELSEISRRLHTWLHQRLDGLERAQAARHAAAKRRRSGP